MDIQETEIENQVNIREVSSQQDASVAITSDTSLSDIVKILPALCFQKDQSKAWSLVAANLLVLVISYYCLLNLPFYCIPFLWVITGTALTGLFILGHDCGHQAFSEKQWINELFGHLFMLPVIYPFHNWCVQHNRHHAWTNKLGGARWKQVPEMLSGKSDPAWQPLRPEVYENLRPKEQWIYTKIRGGFWWLASVKNWWYQLHMNSAKLSPKDEIKVKISTTLVIVFGICLSCLLVFTGGIWGFIKLWLVPWLIFHFWLSTFTLIHHSYTDNHWKSGENWNAAQAQLFGTVHCNYPRWVEFLCHDINYHIPHHISTRIPFYNLRLATDHLRQAFGSHLRESSFSWGLLKKITTNCHLYDPATGGYQSFSEYIQNNAKP